MHRKPRVAALILLAALTACALAFAVGSALAATAPDTAITAGPSGTYRSGAAPFTLSSAAGGASFECSLDGAAFEPCSSQPTFEVANGSHRLEARAVTAGGGPDPSPAVRTWWADASFQNGNFETPSGGWTSQGYTVPGFGWSGGTLQVVDGGLTGGKKTGRFTASGSGSPTISTAPDPYDAISAGVTLTARGSIRGQTSGRSICLKLREYQTGATSDTLVNSAQTCVTTNGAWQSFPALTYTTQQNGSYVDALVFQTSAGSAGEIFYVDGLSVSEPGSPSVPALPEVQGDPVLLGLADIASCWSAGDEATARLLDTTPGVIGIAGDTEQNHGEPAEFQGCYEPTWGRHKWRTKPAVGDHEYGTAGAAGYFGYYGSAAGETGKGWYSYDLGTWHIVVLNSNCELIGGCGPGSEQYEWLQDDLAENAGSCVGAYWHHPRWSAGATHGSLTKSAPFWDVLYEYGAEFVYSGNDHTYQRFAPQTPSGQVDQARGLRQFVVGTGGTQHYPLNAPLANTQVQTTGTFGALKLTLHANSYEWRFLPQDGRTFTDTGTTDCSPLTTDTQSPETTIDSGPTGLVASTMASVSFSSSEAGSTFECKLDTGAWLAAPPRARSPGSRRAPTPSACAPPTPPATSTRRRPCAAGPSTPWRPTPRSAAGRVDPPPPPARASRSGPPRPARRSSASSTPAPGRAAPRRTCSRSSHRDRTHSRCERPTLPATSTRARPRARGRWTPRPRTPRSPVAPPARWPPPRPASPSLHGDRRDVRVQARHGRLAELHLAARPHGARAGRPQLPRTRHRHRRKRRRHGGRAHLDRRHHRARHHDRHRAHRHGRLHVGHARVLVRRRPGQLRVQARRGRLGELHPPRALTGLAQGAHTFRVRATDATGNTDATEATRSWTVDTVAPDTTITSGPSGPTASDSASLAFTSTETGSSFECKLDDGAWQNCTSPRALTGLAQGAHTFRVRATDPAGNTDATEATRSWTVDTVAPDSTISSGPSGTAASTTAAIGFSSDDAQATFQCKLDDGAWQTCTSPRALTGLAQGAHTFRVRATDLAGNVDPSEAARTWSVDTVAPSTSIASGPSGLTPRARPPSRSPPRRRDRASSAGSTPAQWQSCSSPHALTGLSDGAHVFAVRATDAAGNTDQTEATRSWTVDTGAPDTTIASGPSGPTASTSASLGFTATETGSTFQCKLDDGAWQTCTSPRALTGLAQGAHTFRVRATDPAGNVDPTRGGAHLERRHRRPGHHPDGRSDRPDRGQDGLVLARLPGPRGGLPVQARRRRLADLHLAASAR